MGDLLQDILLLSSAPGFDARLDTLRSTILSAARLAGYDSKENQTVVTILHEVAEQGDDAVARYTEKFDGVKLRPDQFRVTREALEEAHGTIDARLLESLRKAIRNVRAYQEKIFIGDRRELSQGTGIRYTPIRRVGVCAPGAAAPLPSTVIMTVVPAQVAGVKEIAVVSPPRFEGTIHPVILAVCHELKVEEVYRLGGVQAVGALAHGTQTIAKVDKIVGPGNKWVQAAKKNVAGDYVGIDSIAGPSEVLILANSEANPTWVAADMLSQAEHAPGSAVVFTDNVDLAKKVMTELKDQVERLGRSDSTRACLEQYSAIIVFAGLDEAVAVANDFASEHLEIQCGQASRAIAERIKNAGAIFIGPYTPVAVGDYWAGPSHTLPTGQTAKFFSPLSSNDFIKSSSIIEYDRAMLTKAADDIVRLARTEGLDAHARSIEIRREKP